MEKAAFLKPTFFYHGVESLIKLNKGNECFSPGSVDPIVFLLYKNRINFKASTNISRSPLRQKLIHNVILLVTLTRPDSSIDKDLLFS